MKIIKLITLISIIVLLVACSEDKWPFYNGELGDCPWCENGYDTASIQCIHCENGVLTDSVSCWVCHGNGYKVCPYCKGWGRVWKLDQNGDYHYGLCDVCNGQTREWCYYCNGKGYYFIDKLGNRSPF